MLKSASISQITAARSSGEGRRLFWEKNFDLVVVDAPLKDESGESLARQLAMESMAQVMLIVNNAYYDAVAAVCGGNGVLTISKPLDRIFFGHALTLVKSLDAKIRMMHAENERLKQRIEDIRIVDRAKCILISRMSMSEQDAHRFIEKQAMDMRSSKRAIAEGILKVYEC